MTIGPRQRKRDRTIGDTGWPSRNERYDGEWMPYPDCVSNAVCNSLSKEWVHVNFSAASGMVAGTPPCGRKRERWEVCEWDRHDQRPVRCKLVT
jgi:hypothetical protein